MDQQNNLEETMFYQCVDCDYASAVELELMEHMKDVHDSRDTSYIPEPSDEINAINENDGNYTCQDCNYRAKTKASIEYHIKFTHRPDSVPDLMKCTKLLNGKMCTFSGNMRGLKMHIKALHDNIKDFKCPQCAYTTAYKYEINRHMKRIHEKIKDFKCHLCTYATSRTSDLNRHIYMRHPYKKNQKTQVRSTGLQRNCSFIGDTIDDCNRIIKITRVSSLSDDCIRPYKCHVCTYNAKQPGHLKHHIKAVHERIKEYKCHLCAYETALKSHLKQHVNQHHDKAKDYKCPICDFATSRKADLKRHMKGKQHRHSIKQD